MHGNVNPKFRIAVSSMELERAHGDFECYQYRDIFRLSGGYVCFHHIFMPFHMSENFIIKCLNRDKRKKFLEEMAHGTT